MSRIFNGPENILVVEFCPGDRVRMRHLHENTKMPGVYVCFYGQKCLYVGQSASNVFSRLWHHFFAENKAKHPEVKACMLKACIERHRNIRCLVMTHFECLDSAEVIAISRFRPMLNSIKPDPLKFLPGHKAIMAAKKVIWNTFDYIEVEIDKL